jgi:hypothetical protein
MIHQIISRLVKPAVEKQKAEDHFLRERERERLSAHSVEMAGLYCGIRAPHLMVRPKSYPF